MNKIVLGAVMVLLGIVSVPALAGAQSNAPGPSFDATYEQYTSAAAALRASIASNLATLSDQKTYFDAVVKLFMAQNYLMLSDLSAHESNESIQEVIGMLQEDIKTLQELSEEVSAVSDLDAMEAVAQKVSAYIRSYATAVRQPVLVVYADQFYNTAIVPAQSRYDAMKAAVDGAKQQGKDVSAYETALQEVRLKLYEANGFLNDVVDMLARGGYSLDAIEKDMQQAQEIVKAIYATYKDLSLKSGALFAQ